MTPRPVLARFGWRLHQARIGVMRVAFALWNANTGVTFVLLGGWLAFAIGFVDLFGPKVWPFAIGVGCWSLAGWRFLWRLIKIGLYELSQEEKRDA